MKASTQISLYTLIDSKNLVSGKDLDKIKKKIKTLKNKDIVIDFNKISFVSMSFIRHYLLFKYECHNKNITEINRAEEVYRLFYLIENSDKLNPIHSSRTRVANV